MKSSCEDGTEINGDAIVVDLEWTFARDLDLAALAQSPDGSFTLIRAGNEGKRAAQPYIHLAHQSRGNGRSKSRREHLIVTRLSIHRAIYLFVMDADAASEGRIAECLSQEGSYRLMLKDRTNQAVELGAGVTGQGNCVYAGTVEDGRVRSGNDAMALSGAKDVMTELVAEAKAEYRSWH